MGLSTGIWVKGDGARSGSGLDRGGRDYGVEPWPGPVAPVAAVPRELACSCLTLISQDRKSILLTSVTPAPSVCSRHVCEMNKSQQKAPLDTV